MTRETIQERAMLGLNARFSVSVDGIGLGNWSSCKGIGVQFEHEEVESGGNYEHVVLLPKRLKYGTVTLQRAMSLEDSAKVQAWLRQVTSCWYSSDTATGYEGSSAVIELRDAHGQRVASWTLRNVYPRNWKGPDLDADNTKVSLETLELAHQGFL
ncbi:phage tail protein [Streptomyces sp. NPDC090021]|uniref:phage tail protein n=1 Tax=Streptomyces sp. NPDC090021 TaxID=3365919 RepID=UPI00380708DA